MSKSSDSDDKTVHLKAVPPGKPPKDAPVAKIAAAPKAAVVKPVVVPKPAKDAQPQSGMTVKKPAFVDRVAAESGLKKSDVKAAVDAVLSTLLQSLAQGEELQLPPLGKLKVQNSKDVGGGATAYTLKLRTPKAE